MLGDRNCSASDLFFIRSQFLESKTSRRCSLDIASLRLAVELKKLAKLDVNVERQEYKAINGFLEGINRPAYKGFEPCFSQIWRKVWEVLAKPSSWRSN